MRHRTVAVVQTCTGAVVSPLMKVTVWEAVPTLPHPSVTVQLLVTLRLQLLPCSAPMEIGRASCRLRLSVTVAAPHAAAICASVGLHPRAAALAMVSTGAV